MDLREAPPLKKKDSISPSNYQLPAAPHLGVGFVPPARLHAGLLSDLGWHMSCACVTLSVSSHVQVSCSVSQTLLPCDQPHLAL